jgi:hypothetical protein
MVKKLLRDTIDRPVGGEKSIDHVYGTRNRLTVELAFINYTITPFDNLCAVSLRDDDCIVDW